MYENIRDITYVNIHSKEIIMGILNIFGVISAGA